MKKFTSVFSMALASGALLLPANAAQAATFDCSTAAIWAYDGDDNSLRKINPFGTVVSSTILDDEATAGDVSISPDYAHAYLVTGLKLYSFNASTGALDSGYPKDITGDLTAEWSVAAGVIDGGNIIVDGDGTHLYSINPGTGVSTTWADITNAEASLPAGVVTGGTWSTGADLVQAVDGSVYALADYDDGSKSYPLIVKINTSNTAQMTVVGSLPENVGSPWGMARAGDNMYVTDNLGTHIYQLGPISSVASVAAVSAIDAGDFGEGRLWGLAGTNDSTPGATNCTFNLELGKTGMDNESLTGFAMAGIALLGFGVIMTRVRRRKASI